MTRDPTNSQTWQEILSQPGIWRDWADPLAKQAREIADWIARRAPDAIRLSGAGTSAFVGGIAASGDPRLTSSATTDMVSCPQDWLHDPGHLLSIQFGRSGNSSESLGLLDLLDAHRPEADRLSITCNSDGALANRSVPGPGQARALVLPEATHDQGFAMTSSFSTMLLSVLACLGAIDARRDLPRLADSAEAVLSQVLAFDAPRPARAIFLGSGALLGAARESALKVLELTAGETMTAWDSPLGFRHGPKAAVTADTHVFVSLHPDPHTARYDADLVAEIRRQYPETAVTTLGKNGDIGFETSGDVRADAVLHVLAAQVLSARWSALLGLAVDDPFHGRNLTRVVSGVTLYPYSP
jgi:tagatose-6-phosphate ketose/aldose isomerase